MKSKKQVILESTWAMPAEFSEGREWAKLSLFIIIILAQSIHVSGWQGLSWVFPEQALPPG